MSFELIQFELWNHLNIGKYAHFDIKVESGSRISMKFVFMATNFDDISGVCYAHVFDMAIKSDVGFLCKAIRKCKRMCLAAKAVMTSFRFKQLNICIL